MVHPADKTGAQAEISMSEVTPLRQQAELFPYLIRARDCANKVSCTAFFSRPFFLGASLAYGHGGNLRFVGNEARSQA
jgi:hypothetical protein